MVENSTFTASIAGPIESGTNETELYEFLETNYEEIVIFTEDYTFVSSLCQGLELD